MKLAEPVESLGDPRAQRIADVAKPSHSNTKVALIEDEEPLVNALAAGVEFVEVYHERGHAVPSALAQALEDASVPVAAVDGALLTRVFRTDKRPRWFGVAKVPRPAWLEDLEDRAGDIVILDGVRIVGNIGAIIRTATAFNAAGIVLIDSGLSTIADRRLLRASRGYVFSLPVVLAQADELARFLDDQRIRVAVLDAGAPTSLEELAGEPERRALVFGSERTGPSARFRPGGVGREPLPLAASIPMPGPVESLNVSVAVAVTLYALTSPKRGLDVSDS
ncbi:MAG: NshR/TsnR family 23S rRNA methyltransferase [Bifidobacteriaceae bacterium]|nr:NshR/TsnR family 23S rRNA methyltransferase [Bifidobacteriaceae bacterium]